MATVADKISSGILLKRGPVIITGGGLAFTPAAQKQPKTAQNGHGSLFFGVDVMIIRVQAKGPETALFLGVRLRWA